MGIEYQNKPIEWDNAGIMPPQDLIEKGFQPGYKPPAEYFNAILHNTSETIKEIQEKTVELSESAGGGTVGSTIIDVSCTYTEPDTEAGTSGEYTITTDVDLQSEDFFCLRFVSPNDYVKDTVFTIGSESYTAVNAGFKENDLVILNFDVSQQKCFFVSGGGDDKSAGKKVEGETFTIDETEVIAKSGAEIFNNYNYNKASGYCSTAMGTAATASGYCSIAMGSSTISSGDSSMSGGRKTTASGEYSTAMGWETIASGSCSVAMGWQATANDTCAFAMGNKAIANGMYSVAMGYEATANENNVSMGSRNKTPTAGTSNGAGDVFIIGNGTYSTKSNAFRITMAGNVMGTKSYTASGADYAEMFEWADGNPDNEDRRGLFVTLDGEKIRPASADDDYILGVVSATPSVVADAQTDDWGKKWKTDVFGERLLDENGAWILNENFREEENESYVSRLDRKEWAAVGLVGKLILVDDGTCEVNGYCVPANGGKATKSETGYRVLSRVDENHIKVLIK